MLGTERAGAGNEGGWNDGYDCNDIFLEIINFPNIGCDRLCQFSKWIGYFDIFL